MKRRCALAMLVLPALLGAAACRSASTVGPFVTSVTRTPRGLEIQSCEIVLRGSDLSAGKCGSWTVPLDDLRPLPPPGPPGSTPPEGSAPPPPPRAGAAQAITPEKLAELLSAPASR